MSDATMVRSEAISEGGLSEIERVVDAFIAPSKTFTDILRSASWWLPFLLVVIFSTAATLVVDREVGIPRVVENQVQASPAQEEQMSSLDPAQREARMHGMEVGYKYSMYGTPLILLVIFLIYSAIIMASFNFGLGARTTYNQVMAVTFYAGLPYLLLSVLTVLTVHFGGNAESYDLKNPVGTNLAYYMDLSPGLKAFLGSFDVIKLWSLGLTVLGMKIIAKTTMGKAAAVVVGWWLIFVIVSSGVAAAFS